MMTDTTTEHKCVRGRDRAERAAGCSSQGGLPGGRTSVPAGWAIMGGDYTFLGRGAPRPTSLYSCLFSVGLAFPLIPSALSCCSLYHVLLVTFLCPFPAAGE